MHPGEIIRRFSPDFYTSSYALWPFGAMIKHADLSPPRGLIPAYRLQIHVHVFNPRDAQECGSFWGAKHNLVGSGTCSDRYRLRLDLYSEQELRCLAAGTREPNACASFPKPSTQSTRGRLSCCRGAGTREPHSCASQQHKRASSQLIRQ